MNSIPKIYSFGTRHTNGILNGQVVIEEKYDGSQFTFGVTDDKLWCRSKNSVLEGVEPGMFEPAVNTARELHRRAALVEGWVYCCEFLAKQKHNVLCYSRTPKGFLVLYDVRGASGLWLNSATKIELANTLGLEPVQVFCQVKTTEFDMPVVQKNMLAMDSSLGGVKVEGIVIKNYGRSHGERGVGWPMTAKIVSDAFKEKHTLKQPKAEPNEFIQVRLINSLRTEARWLKAVQHLKESGALKNDNCDIGPLCKEVQGDVLAEETEWIKQQLFDEFSREITKGVVNGLAQWYQKKLAEGWSVFEETEILKNK
jgi:hypothetical protein